MVRLALAFIAALIVFCLLMWGINLATRPARADEAHMRRYHADAEQDQWMRSLQRPGGEGSCCSLNDCLPTDAEWREGQWWAIVRGIWTAIPPGKVLTSPLSMDGESWVCAGPGAPGWTPVIYCFVPPLSSY
jgi:hypothetical protein